MPSEIYKKLAIVFGGIIFTALLFVAPALISKQPLSTIQDPLSAVCPFFVDKNEDAVCDVLQGGSTSNSSLDFRFSLQAGLVLALLALSVLVVFQAEKLGWRNFSKIRNAFLVISLLLGLLYWRYLCPVATLQLLFLIKDKIVVQLPLFLIFITPIITTLIFGRIFCGFVCPLGAFQELVYRVVRYRGKLRLPDFSRKIPPIFGYLKYLILAVLVFAVIGSGQTIFCQIDPFAALNRCSSALLPKILLVALVLATPFIFRVYCRFFCPYGAVLALFSKLSIFGVRYRKTDCAGCKLCEKKCLAGAVKKVGKVDASECMVCQECVTNCPKKALLYRQEGKHTRPKDR